MPDISDLYAKVQESLDTDTRQYGTDPPFRDWEHDHTGLVHVLWAAKHRGLTLEKDTDAIATMIMHSRWLHAQRAHYRDAG
jgi:hypothetical protein